jgi:hypothetical protein
LRCIEDDPTTSDAGDQAREMDRWPAQKSGARVCQPAGLTAAVALLTLMSVSTTVGQQARTWSHAQTVARDSGGASNSLTFASVTQAGNLIIAEVDWSEESDFVSINDSQGNVYAQVGGEQHSSSVGVRSRLYYAANIRGGADTITTVVSGSPAWHEVYLHEYSGLDPLAPLDAFSVAVGIGTEFTGGAVTIAASHDLLYGIEIDSSIASAAPGWSTRSTLNGNIAADGDASAPGSYAFAGSSAGAFIAWTVAFKQGGGTPPPETAPSTAPVISSFTASPSSITTGLSATLSWGVSNATSLSIDNGVGDVTGLTSTVVSPTANVTYHLTASNSDGSATAQTTVVVSLDTGAPTVPTNLSATPNSSFQVTLSWIASTDDVAVTGYKILRNGIQVVGVAAGAVYVDGNLAAGTTYTYAVAAYDAAGNTSAWSQSISVTTLPQSDSQTYATTFPVAESPISEGGRWINGKTVGFDWSDVLTTPGLAFGTQTGSDGFDDSIAMLQGNWGPDQSAMATVQTGKQQDSSVIKEVEILLRWAISAHSATGYEIDFSTTGQYVQIVRWDGPLGNFTYLESRPLPKRLRDGDVVKATIVGQIITAFVNDVPVAEASDSTYAGGSPGMGFYLQGTDASADFGFTSYVATAQTGPSWAHVQSTAGNSGAKSNALALPSATRDGDLLVVEVDWSSGSDFVSISDSQGNAFTQVGTEQEAANFGVKSRLYYAANINGGAHTVTTVVTGSPSYHELYLHEYSGLDPISPLDAFSVNVANGTTFTSGEIKTTAGHDLLYGIEIDARSATADADWTTRSRLDSNVAADRDAPSPGTYVYDGQSTGAFITWLVAFKQATKASLPVNTTSTISNASSILRNTVDCFGVDAHCER